MTEQLFFLLSIGSQKYQFYYQMQGEKHKFKATMTNIQLKASSFIITKAYAMGTSEANAIARLRSHISTAIERGTSYSSANPEFPGEVKLITENI